MAITTPKQINMQFLLPLALLYLTIYLTADSVAYKIIKIGNSIEPGPPFIFPLSYAIADIITEVYGYKLAQRIIWLTLIFQLLYATCISLIIHLPSYKDETQISYFFVFGHILHFVLAGTISVVTSSFVNVYAIAKWKILTKGRHFWLRSLASSAISGFILILLIILFGYMWTVDFHTALVMFASIYSLEFLYACITVWPSSLIAAILKQKENLDVYDVDTNFNPFVY